MSLSGPAVQLLLLMLVVMMLANAGDTMAASVLNYRVSEAQRVIDAVPLAGNYFFIQYVISHTPPNPPPPFRSNAHSNSQTIISCSYDANCIGHACDTRPPQAYIQRVFMLASFLLLLANRRIDFNGHPEIPLSDARVYVHPSIERRVSMKRTRA